MDDRELRVLLIENDPDDARYITENLSTGARASWRAPALSVTHVDHLEPGLARLDAAVSGDAPSIDGVLVGARLPDGPPDEILSTLHERFPHIAKVALVARGDAARTEGDAATGVQAILYEDEIRGNLLARTMMHAIDRQAHTQALQEMAHRHQALFDQAHDAIFILDLEGRHVQANRRAAEMLGYSDEEMQRLSFRDISAEPAQSKQVIDRLLRGERIPLYERRFRTKDGTILPVEINVELVRDCEGRPQYIQSVARDISARKQAVAEREATLKALRESEARYRALVQTSPESIVLSDLEGRILFCNPQTAAMYGTEQVDDLIGENVFSFIVPEHRERAQTYAERALRGEKIQAIEYKVNRMDGSQFFAEVSASLIRDEDGHPQAFIGITRDITARKQAELQREAAVAALRESEARFRLIYETSPVGIAMTANDYHFVEANSAFCEFLGYPEAELRELTVFDVCHPEERASGRRSMAMAEDWPPDKTFDMERRYVRKDGAVVWGHTALARVYDAEGAPSFWLGLTQDITEHKRMEMQREAAREALRESVERFRLAMDATEEGLWDWNVKTGEIYRSPGYARMLGYEPEAFLPTSRPWLDQVHPDDREALIIVNRECVENVRDGFEIEFRMQAKDGEWRWILGRAEAVARDSKGRATRVIGTHADITKRKQSELQREAAIEALQESQSRLEALSRRLVRAQESERRSLAHELHDEVGQVLAVVRLNLQALKAKSQPEAATVIRSCLDILDAAIDQMRNLSRELRPSLLDNLGLAPALRAFIDQKAQNAPFDATFTSGDLEGRLPQHLENAYFRIVQEALTHVVPYAQAGHVAVDLRLEDETLVLTLRHDGMGFDVEEALVAVDGERSLGLTDMRERAYLIGGAFEIRSEPGAGTVIRIRTPIEPSEPGA